jgi:hypothetical protein
MFSNSRNHVGGIIVAMYIKKLGENLLETN